MGPLVEVIGVTKRYGPVTALDGVSIRLEPGVIHAVIGENGAGKSTLVEVLGGFVRPEEGQVLVNGAPLNLGDPSASSLAGVAMVHQHFMLVPEFTVEENLALARLAYAGWKVSAKDLAREALKIGESLGWRFEAKRRVRDLSVGMQQRLEILKALSLGGGMVLFDEPTAVLRKDEVDELFRVLSDLRAQGRTVVLIAHKLSEVLDVSDRITVLRKGKHVATADRSEVDGDTLSEWMLGERIARSEAAPASEGAVAISVENLVVYGDRGEVKVDGVSFEALEGQILGIGGVDGNGQVELAETLAGIRKPASGTIERQGPVVYLPPDRHRDGLALEWSVQDNLLIEGHRRHDLRQGPFLNARRIENWADGLRKAFQVDAPSVNVPARSLSGGNQQKILVARALDAHPEILVAVNPTRGLDVRASAFVRGQLQAAGAQGCSVILFSTDLDELDELASSQLFMSGGRISSGSFDGALLGGTV